MDNKSNCSSEDEDDKVRKRLDREYKQEQEQGITPEILEKTGMSMSELKELLEIFQLVDLDHSGAISKEELQSLMGTLGLRINNNEIENMILEADPENTGEIDFNGFVMQASKKVQTNYTLQEILLAFKRFMPPDSNDFKLSTKTLVDILSNYGDKDKRLPVDEAMDLIAQIGNGRQDEFFDFNNFCSVYLK